MIKLQKIKNLSLYSLISIVVFIIMTISLLLQMLLSYNHTKDNLNREIENNINVSFLHLKNSITPLIESYQVIKYEKLIKNELVHTHILSIELEDYLMGELLSKKSYKVGFIKSSSSKKEIFKKTNKHHVNKMKEVHSLKEENLIGNNGEIIGKIKIYATNEYMKKELLEIFFSFIKTALISYLILYLVFLYILKKYLLNPINEMVENFKLTDEEGLPSKKIEPNCLGEFNILANVINNMIEKIKSSQFDIKINEEKFRKIFNHSGIGIARVSLKGELLEVNDKLSEIIGYSKEELITLTFQDITYEDDLYEDVAYLNKMISREINLYEMEKRYVKKDESLAWVKITVTLILNDKKEPDYFISMIDDINEQKNYQKNIENQNLKLLSLKNTLDNAVNIATLGTWEADLETDTISWSDITYDIYNVPKNKEIKLSDVESLVIEEDKEKYKMFISKALKEDISFNFEYRIKKESKIRTILSICNPIVYKHKVVKLVGVVQDITDIKEKETQLLEAQRIANVGHYDYNIIKNTFTTSEILDEIFGIPINHNKTVESWLEIIHPDDRDRMKEHFEKALLTKNKFDKEYRVIDYTTKKTKWVHGLGIFIYNEETNEPIKMFGTIQDITYRKKYERNMQQALSVFEHTHDGIMITDKDNKIINVNPAFTISTGYSKEEVIGKNPNLLKSHKNGEEFYKNMWEEINKNGYWSGEIVNKTKDGGLVEELLSISTIKIDNKIDTYIGIFSDISVQKHQEKMLLQQSRTAAVGEMIGNIAHQWRQPLSVISAASTGLNVSLELNKDLPSTEISYILEQINKQTQHLSKTIEDFRNFFKGDMTQTKEFNLKDILLKIEELTIDSFNSRFIKIEKDWEDDIFIELNESLLIQALLNIYNNTLDALEENLIFEEEKVFIITLKKENNQAVIEIKDNAGGIGEENLKRIFEPYFTTKHESIGTGLGLYMTYQIITKQLGGKISVHDSNFKYKNKSYVGAKFRIVF